MLLDLQTGVTRRPDNSIGPARGGNQGEQITAHLNPKYYEQTMRGNAFVYTTTTAASVTALGNNNPTLWNPLGSGKILVLNKLTLQVAAIGTPVISGFQYGFIANAGSQIATASPVLTGTLVTANSLSIGGPGSKSTMNWLPAACTFTTAPAFLCAVGINLGATATQTPWIGVDDIDGRIVLFPGGLIQVAASTATSTTFNVSLMGTEIQLPQVN